MQINQPKGIQSKMREDKLRSDVNWRGALKQKGALGVGTRALRFHDTAFNILGIRSRSFNRRQRKYKLSFFKHAKNIMFIGPCVILIVE